MLKKIINHPDWGEKLADLASSYIRYTRTHSDNLFEPADMDEFFRKHDPFILSVWHGQFLLIPTIRPDDISASIVVGSHGDAELAAKIVTRFGVKAIRGSGAGGRRNLKDRGGAKVLKQAISALKEGDCIVSTADVPPGPAQKVGEGIITMARLSGRPIIPAAIATRRAITFKSWSRLTINLPFSKCALVCGQPIEVPRKATPEELERKRQQLEAAMQEVTARAHQMVGRSPKKIAPLWERSMQPGLGFMGYRLATSLAKPIAPLLFRYRLRRGKELEAREQERYGIASLPRPEGELIWMHAASVGEANATLPLIEQLLARNPALNILLTTGTITSAAQMATRLPERAFHQFLPLDNKDFVHSFLKHWRPNLVAFVESEIWPNLIMGVKARGIPLLLINGRMSKRSFKRWFKKPAFARPIFGRFNTILARNAVDKRHFISLGAENVIESGNLKIDAPPLTHDPAALAHLREHIGDRPLLLAASTHKGEEDIIREAHQIVALDHPDLLTIIIPRHPERRQEILDELSGKGLTLELRSERPEPGRSTNIYIADTMGEMGLFYSLGGIAFIGGSLIPHGGQNPIEAIRLGTTVMTGPKVSNFTDSYDELIRRGGAVRVHSAKEIAATTLELLHAPEKRRAMQQGADDALEYLSGAMSLTIDTIEAYLAPADERADPAAPPSKPKGPPTA